MVTQYPELYADGKLVDLFNPEDVGIYLNYRIITGDELDKRSGNYSDTLRLPGTKNNNLTFGYYNDETVLQTTFTFKKAALVLVGGVKVFSGFMTGKLHMKDGGAGFEYSINMSGNNLSWADILSEQKLFSLTGNYLDVKTNENTAFPNVTFDSANVFSSFSNTESDGFCAPLVCYKEWSDTADLASDKQKFYVEDFKYWIFVRPILKQMFAKAGYKIASDFIDDSSFGKLITYFYDNEIYTTDTSLPIGSTVPRNQFNYSDLIDKDRNCLDFVRGLQHAFNWLFWTDEISKIVYVEPFPNFFKEIHKNINERIDISKGRKKYPYDLSESKVEVGWKTDNDGFKSIFEKISKQRADSVIYTLGRSTDEKAVKTIDNPTFGPAYMGAELIEVSGVQGWALIMPYIFTSTPEWEKVTGTILIPDAIVKPKEHSNPDPRLLFFNGMTTCSAWQDSPHPTTGPQEDNPVPGTFEYEGSAYPERPYAYSIDILEEDFSTIQNLKCHLDFNDYTEKQASADYRTGVMSGGAVVTPGTPFLIPGLARRHWLSFLATIDEGHIWEGYCNWKYTEILELDFRKLNEYKGLSYILLEINKFNPVSKETTSTKLLKKVTATQEHVGRMKQNAGLFIDEYLDLRITYNRYL